MKKAEPDDLIVMVGGRVGKDGIHGATFSSEALHEHSPVTAVQIGDPITQKKMTDMLLIARDRELYHSITDNGAGGLSSSVGEMARESGGCEIDLEKAPIKYQGLLPWELLLSESQERMTLAVAPEKIAKFLSLSKKMDVEAIVIGKFSNSGRFHVRYCGKTVAYLTMEFLHQGLPRMNLKAQWVAKQYEDPCFSEPKNLNSLLIEMLGRLNICSKEAVVRQYDHEVQGGSVVKPLVGVQGDGPSDAAVIRPLLDSFEGVVISNGICPKYSDIDTYYMMACAIDEAIRNAVSVGGDLSYMAGLDNFCWCDPVQSEKTPDGEYKLAQLVRANMALYDYTVAFGIPLISGKDSMKNDYHIGDTKISIPPTVLFSLIGKIEDVRKCITMEAKSPGDLVYVVGITLPELGGSEYYDHLGYGGCQVPVVDVKSAKKIYHAVKGAIEEGVVASCHDISDGGLGVALAEVAFSGNLGMEIDLGAVCQKDIDRDDYMLFSESQSRFVMTIKPDNMRRFEEIMMGNCFSCVGVVTEKKVLEISGFSGRIIIDTPLEVLKHSWQEKLRF